MTTPNSWMIYDDSANTSTSGGGAGGGSGQPLLAMPFNAPSAAAAVTMAHLFASVMQRPVRLGSLFSQAYVPLTLIQGALAGVALTSVPSGAGW